MSKLFKENDWTDKLLPIASLLMAAIFTYFGFIHKQSCDIDRIYLWCRLHPISLFDIIGIIMWYAGCFLISGVYKFWNEAHKITWNIIWIAIMALSIIIIWNL